MALFFIFFCTFPLFFTVVCHRYVTNRKRIPPYSFANYDGILFRLSEKQLLFSFYRSENISQFIIFSLLLLFLLLLLSLQDCRFSFSLSRYGNGISFLFSVLFCRCMCISFLFSALRSSDSCHFLCGTIYQITGCTLHFLPTQNYGFVRFGFCRHFCGRFWKCNLLCTALFAGQTAFDGFCIVGRRSAYRILIQEYGSGCLTDHRHFASLFAVDLIAGCTLYCLNGDLHCRHLFLGNALNAYDLRSLNGF